jgi:hypothetical protein
MIPNFVYDLVLGYPPRKAIVSFACLFWRLNVSASFVWFLISLYACRLARNS